MADKAVTTNHLVPSLLIVSEVVLDVPPLLIISVVVPEDGEEEEVNGILMERHHQRFH